MERTDESVEIFLQGQDIPDMILLRVPKSATAKAILEAAGQQGLKADAGADLLLFIEDGDSPISLEEPLEEVGIRHRSRLHVHTCRRVAVSANFNGQTKLEEFPPSATVARVKEWAVSKRAFDLDEVDATEHVLQVCDSNKRPDEDRHIGILVTPGSCDVCFDLVPKQRVEG